MRVDLNSEIIFLKKNKGISLCDVFLFGNNSRLCLDEI